MGKKDGMYLYNDWLAPFEKLEKHEVGELVLAMMRYSINGEEPPEFHGLLAMAADFIFPQIDRSMEYARLGSKGGIASSKKATKKSLRESAAPLEKIEEKSCGSFCEEAKIGTDNIEDAFTAEEYVWEDCRPLESNEQEGKNGKNDPPPTVAGGGFADQGLYEKMQIENKFNKFWRNYPRKVERQRAFNIFKKLDPDDSLVREMVDAIEKQKKTNRWKKDNGQYIPYPANWLEGKRWEDEVDMIDSSPLESEDAHLQREDPSEGFFEESLKRFMDYM